MKFGKYTVDTVFLILAAVFMFTAIVQDNMAFLGVVIICAILGIKKTG